MFEKVNPSHPDKLADRIAGAIVDLAYKIAPDPRIAVEVLIGHDESHIIVIEKGIIRKDCNPELLAKEYYSFPIYLLLEMSAKYDDIPQDKLDKFFKETEEHARFLLDCVKVK